MNGAKRFVEAVGCKNESVGERSALERSTRASRVGRSGSENVGLSNENIGENLMPRKPKDSSARFCRKVKEVGDLMTGKQTTEAPVNGDRNYNGPKVAKFLVGLGGRQRRPPSRGARAISEIPL
ncbi:hypothetical protein KIW84_030480 [Lathyrus oleraceus]|uniref:Uncharacterized protein n=1 Tax=Pisum sativum TaxID=3888 RepID=A0A9D4XN70_PEA|nr:hypothetical protein KIW84_030480 [Pisum sativum]